MGAEAGLPGLRSSSTAYVEVVTVYTCWTSEFTHVCLTLGKYSVPRFVVFIEYTLRGLIIVPNRCPWHHFTFITSEGCQAFLESQQSPPLSLCPCPDLSVYNHRVAL